MPKRLRVVTVAESRAPNLPEAAAIDNDALSRAVIKYPDSGNPRTRRTGLVVQVLDRIAALLGLATSAVIDMLGNALAPRWKIDRTIGKRSIARTSIGRLAPVRLEPSGTRPPVRGRAEGQGVHASPRFLTVGVRPEFGPRDYASTFAALQVPPLSKLLDLVPVRLLCSDVFEHLADAWIAGSDAVPRLGILLSFERWVMLGNTALIALERLAARGVKINVFYAEQASAGHLAAWFAHGRFVHNVPAAIATLTAHWYPSTSSPVVLDMLARLVGADASTAELPGLLTQIAALALSCGDAERAATYASQALLYMPEPPSATRCRALRELGTAFVSQGRTTAGLALLEEAHAMAAQVKVPDVGASALCHSGLCALNHGDYPGAERRFRGAIELLSVDDRRRHLLAFAHHNLAVALMQQSHPDAERHAEAALTLRPGPDSHLAEQDRLLLAKLRGDRADVDRGGDSAAPDDCVVSDEPSP